MVEKVFQQYLATLITVGENGRLFEKILCDCLMLRNLGFPYPLQFLNFDTFPWSLLKEVHFTHLLYCVANLHENIEAMLHKVTQEQNEDRNTSEVDNYISYNV